MKKDKCQLNEYFDEKKENVKKNQKENEIFNNVNLIKNVYYQLNIMMINQKNVFECQNVITKNILMKVKKNV